MKDAEGPWYPVEYKSDIYQYLKSLERARKPFLNRSPQFQERPILIKWLKKMCEKVKFCRMTLHLAVFLLDFFMDSHVIKTEKLTLIASVCFILAGKLEERDCNVPRISDMNAMLNSSYSKRDIVYLERIILKHFKWKLTTPTALHFAEYFMEYAVIPQDVCQNCFDYNYAYNIIHTAVEELLDLLLEDSSLIEEPPSYIAASCILAVRKSFNLSTTWPIELETITAYSESKLENSANRIIE
ncbi:hypothetical protein V9T40_011555 [Parthenolecanium corni]|uniref:Cyclin-like domain-containing protein n=1 Tax=Parthenolecanium corni TaxID=536013 RepID=A0AAN9XYP4_9HEMI